MSETEKPKNKPEEKAAKLLTPSELRAKIALTGNLAPLNDSERWEYYQAYCQYLGLDPITRPFDLLHTFEKNPDGNGKPIEKVILYANASCSTQIADKREVKYSRPIYESTPVPGLFAVWVEATLPNGRSTWREGIVDAVYHKGKNLENAIKRATTQAHRRATLALCGIAMPDESEIPDIDGAQVSRISPYELAEGHPASEIEISPVSVYARIGHHLRNAGLDDNEGARRFHLEWLAKGAYQTFAQHVKQPVELIVREFGALSPIQPLKISADIAPPEREGPHKSEDPNAEQKAEAERARNYAPGGLRAPAPAPTPAEEPAPTAEEPQAQTLAQTAADAAPADDPMKKRIAESREKTHPAPAQRKGREKAPPRVAKVPGSDFHQNNRNHNAQSAARIDGICTALFAYGVKTEEILNEVNTLMEANEKPRVLTRYELDDDSVNEVCDAFEPWALKLKQNHEAATTVQKAV